MKLEFVEKNYDIGARLATILAKKISKLDKYFPDEAKARIVCKLENKTYKLELTITAKGLLYRAEVVGENMYENIDLVLPKIERQILKASDKRKASFKKDAFATDELLFVEEKPVYKERDIIKRKSFELAPITVQDAKIELDNVGHDFYVFLNAETGKVNVLYKRQDEKLGLIEVNY
ncbi:MAG: ribosome hibernation-promoting factor, HPF/YfiA family [Christensenellales bacterium]|jgi:putative sigma-54 modulation protein